MKLGAPMTLEEILRKYQPHRGLATASLIEKMAAAPGVDPWSLDLADEERNMLGCVLAEESNVPARVDVERALADLTAKRLREHERTLTEDIARAEGCGDTEAVTDNLVLKRVVRRALDGMEE